MSDFRSRFSRWIVRDTTPTHTLMTGGKLHVPLDDFDAFHQAYANFITYGGIACVNTVKTPVFAMYFDVDAHFPCVEFDAVEWRHRLAVRMLQAMHELLQPTDFDVFVCASPPKPITKNGVECIKHGLHIHFPHVYVDRETALWLRESILVKLANYDEVRVHPSSPTTWIDDLDEAVYNNGLRMTYSHKSNTEARAYHPVLHVFADLSVQTTFGNTIDDLVHVLQKAEIRDCRSDSTITHVRQNPSWLPNAVTLARKRRKGRATADPNLITDGDGSFEEKSNITTAQKDAVRHWIGIKIRKGTLPKQYIDAQVTGGFLTDTNAFVRLNSRYCSNVNREHTSSTVYLQFSHRMATACVRCYCRRDTTDGRIDGVCKLYKSAPIQANRLQHVLFPVNTSASQDPDL